MPEWCRVGCKAGILRQPQSRLHHYLVENAHTVACMNTTRGPHMKLTYLEGLNHGKVINLANYPLLSVLCSYSEGRSMVFTDRISSLPLLGVTAC